MHPPSRRILRRCRATAIETLEDRCLLSLTPAGTPNTLTFHGDAMRTGFNQNETVLTPTNVSANFGQVWQSPVLDGHLYASPLYMDSVSITTGGNSANHTGDGVVAGSGKTLGVVFAATGGGTVYAIKAFDTNGPSGVAAGTILWKTFLGSPSAGIDGNSIGALGTPIIDAKANRIYVVASVNDYLLPAADPNHGLAVFEVFALNLSNGAVIAGFPLAVTQSILQPINQNNLAGTGNQVAFGGAGSGAADERGALNLSADGSTLYIPFASYGSSNGGWLVTVATGVTNGVSNGQTPALISAYSGTDQPGTAPGNGGIWGAGGPAIDSNGNVFVSTGDSPGGTKQTLGSWGNSVLGFGPGQTLALSGAYTPWNYQTQDTIDTDLGGAAPIIIQMPSGSSATTELLATGGKQGNAYLVDAGNHLNNPGTTPASLTMRPAVVPPNQDPSLYDPTAMRTYFSPPQAGPLNVFGPYSEQYGMVNYGRSRTTPATFVGPDGSYYVVWTGSQKVTDSSTVPTAPGIVVTKVVATPGQNAYLQIVTQNTQTLSLPGASIITANGTSNPIVWVVDAGVQRSDSLSTGNFNNGAPTLYAFDALTMQPLWSSAYQQLDTGGKYNTIAVARGVAFIGTDRIQAFGLTTNTSVDDSTIGTGNNQFQYVGAWSHATPGTSTATMGTFQGTVSTDSVTGDYATLNFSGSQIKVYATEMSGYGTAAISIDGGAATNVSLANSKNSPNGQGEGDVLVYTSPTLGAGTHTLKFLNTANSTIALDRVEITPLTTTASALRVSLTEGNVTAAPNQVLPYTINYDNAGSIVGSTGVNASGVVLTETVPANSNYNSANSTTGWTKTSGNGGPGSTYTFTVGNLAAGDTGSVVFAVTVNSSIPGGTINLSDTVSISDAASDTASGSRTTPLVGTPIAFKLAFGQQPENARTASAISPAVTVVVQDQFGNTFTTGSNSTVTLTLSSGTFSDGSNTATAQAMNGVATFSNLSINTQGNYSLSATGGSLISTVSSTFSVAAASKLAITAQPANATAGVALNSVSVTVEDVLGNPVTGDTSPVTLTLNGGVFAGGSNTTTVQAVSGVATFNNLVIDAAGMYTLSATDGSLAGAASNSFTIAAGAAAMLGFTQQPASTVAGAALSPVAVAVQDQFGNTIAGDTSTVTLTLSSGIFSTGVNNATAQASAGVATFNNLIINANGSYTLAGSDGNLTGATSSSFTIATTLTIDDTNVGIGVNQVNLVGGWSLNGPSPPTTLRNAYNGTVTNSSTANNTATVQFNGAQIKFYGGLKNNRGIAAVSIDGGPETLIDLYENDGTGDCALVYTSPLLTPGLHTFMVRVTGTKDAASGGTIVSLDRFDLIKGASTITWQNPADIVYSTALGSTQLNATANVPGTFAYTPAAGAMLPAGQGQTLNVSFTPADIADYAPATASVVINVAKANPVIDWDEPAGLFHGQPLTSTQLDATANTPGAFVYNPDVGALLPTQPDNPLSVTFTPTDTADYNTVMQGNVIDVFPVTPPITWTNPADITFGTALSSTQLNATARFNGHSLDGTFTYTPPAGTVLGVGSNQTLGVSFAPANTTDFVNASGSVAIDVNPLTVTNANDSGAGSLRQALLDAEMLPGTTHTIYFQLPAGPQTINPATPLPAISDPVSAMLDATQSVTVDSPASGGANSFSTFTKMGAGSLALSGKNSFSGNVHVANGRLRLEASAPPGLASGISLTVDGAATLELAGAVSNLAGGSQPVNIANDSTASAGVEVSGTHQAVGSITGAGSTTIDAASDLTANRIVQGALVIGGSAGSPAMLTIAPSDSSGNPLAVGTSSAGSQPAIAAPMAEASSSAEASAGMAPPIAATSDLPLVENPPSASPAALPQGGPALGNSQVFDLRAFALGIAQDQAIWTGRKSVSDSPASCFRIADALPTATVSASDSHGNPLAWAGTAARRDVFDTAAVDAIISGSADPVIDDALVDLLAADASDHVRESMPLDSGGDLSASRAGELADALLSSGRQFADDR
jgi:autotransporter-associated beta strand protein